MHLAFCEVTYGMLPVDVGEKISPFPPVRTMEEFSCNLSTTPPGGAFPDEMEVVDLCGTNGFLEMDNPSRKRKREQVSDLIGASQVNPMQAGSQPSSTSPPPLQVHFPPRSFRVVLAMDIREISGSGVSGFRSREWMADRLRETQIPVISRNLPIGDFLWLAIGPMGQEIVLDWVIERKTVDDLVSSIKDGRFSEQKVSALA